MNPESLWSGFRNPSGKVLSFQKSPKTSGHLILRPSPISSPPTPYPQLRLIAALGWVGPPGADRCRGAPAGSVHEAPVLSRASAGHSPSLRSGAGLGGALSGSARVLETALRRYIAPPAALQPLEPRARLGRGDLPPAPPRGGARTPAPLRPGGRWGWVGVSRLHLPLSTPVCRLCCSFRRPRS